MLNIVKSPNPLLNQQCEPCELPDKSLKRLAKQMAQTMYKNNGVGIAAPQVGVLKQLIVIDCGPEDERNPIVLINPVVVETKGEPVTEGEGCLSIPGITVPVSRRPWARVQYYDFDGELWEIEGDGLLGRCLQHETDHLKGVTLFESCTPQVRLRAVTAYEQARSDGARPGDTSIEVRA